LRRRDTLLILGYHGMSMADEHDWQAGLYMKPAQFRSRLEMLRDADANVLSLKEGLARLYAGSLPPRSVVITFDDGFQDFYRHAFPLLQEFGFPATVYQTTYYSGHRLPIFNLIISYLLWKRGHHYNSTGIGRMQEVDRLVQKVTAQGLNTEERNEFAANLAKSSGVDYQQVLDSRMLQLMSPDEVSEIAGKGVDVQLHTHRHRAPAARELFMKEILDNSRSILDWTGKQANHFCYPSSITSPQFLPWLAECGVRSAVTCNTRLAKSTSDPLLLPRFLDSSSVTSLDFESWLRGAR